MPEINGINEQKAKEFADPGFQNLIILMAAAQTWAVCGNTVLALRNINDALYLAQKLKNEKKIAECQEILRQILNAKKEVNNG